MFVKFKDIVDNLKITPSGIIHVGGHVGEEIPEYLFCTSNINIFEPIKECFDKIPDNVKKYNCAIGDIEQNCIMNIANNHQSSSLLKPKKHLEEHPTVIFTHNIEVPVKTLDSFNIVDCNYLIMDVQGYEMHVLKGALNTLNYIDVIYTEVNMDEIYENNCLMKDMDEWLKGYSFNRVWHYDTGHKWGDAIYVRN